MKGLPWHPMIVHFPLALMLTSALCLLASRMIRRASVANSLAVVGSWNLVLAAFSALVAIGSGLITAGHVHTTPEGAANLNMHLAWAVGSGLVVVGLAVFRGAGVGPSGRPRNIFLVLLGVASIALIITGFYGGENVYRFGLGILGPT